MYLYFFHYHTVNLQRIEHLACILVFLPHTVCAPKWAFPVSKCWLRTLILQFDFKSFPENVFYPFDSSDIKNYSCILVPKITRKSVKLCFYFYSYFLWKQQESAQKTLVTFYWAQACKFSDWTYNVLASNLAASLYLLFRVL